MIGIPDKFMKLTFLKTILIISVNAILTCSVELDFEFTVTVDSCMSSNSCVVDFYSFAQFTRLNIFIA